MRRSFPNWVLSAITVATSAALCGGCGPYDTAPPYAEKVGSVPDTYRIVFARGCPSLRPRVLRAWVFDSVPAPNVSPYAKAHQWYDLNMKIEWEVIARKPIPAEGFQITVGMVPGGFEQMVPAGRPFVPQPGKKYSFEFETDWPCYQTYGVDSVFLDSVEREHAKQR